ncbi:MAG: YihY/virulence factor BrkB family protein [Lachnospiraceae bacterium]|nr:YihY/virulence factor BrkB family protein [Lachnospiraceae bacterium]
MRVVDFTILGDGGNMRKVWKKIRFFSKDMGRQNLSAFSASTAFFFFLSLVPMLIMLCTIIPYTPLTEEILLTAMRGWIPEKIFPLAEGLVKDVYERSEGLLSIAAIVTLWTAGKGMLALMRGLNAIDDIKETRSYVWVRIVSSFYTILMLVMVVLSLLVVVFGNRFVDMLLYKMPKLQPLVALLMHFRFLAIWVLLTLLFIAIFAFVPNGRLKLREQIPGAIFTAVGWSIFSWGFSLYVDWTDYSIYGSLSIIVLVMLWLYFCMYIVMLGAYVNKFLKTEID